MNTGLNEDSFLNGFIHLSLKAEDTLIDFHLKKISDSSTLSKKICLIVLKLTYDLEDGLDDGTPCRKYRTNMVVHRCVSAHGSIGYMI